MEPETVGCAFYNVGLQESQFQSNGFREWHARFRQDLRALAQSWSKLHLLHLCEVRGHGVVWTDADKEHFLTVIESIFGCPRDAVHFNGNYIAVVLERSVAFHERPTLRTFPATVRSGGQTFQYYHVETLQSVGLKVYHVHNRSSKNALLKDGARGRVLGFLLEDAAFDALCCRGRLEHGTRSRGNSLRALGISDFFPPSNAH